MQLVTFSVSNYRSITTAYKLPIRQSTILLGPNNEGKSNILKGLVTALGTLGALGSFKLLRGRLRSTGRDIGVYNWTQDFPISLQTLRPDGESYFSLEFRLSAAEVEEFGAEVSSNLNGNLPIQLSFGKGDPGFKVVKRGPGGPALSKKAEAIARFIAKRVNLTYIPAIRTSEEAHNVVGGIVDRELAAIESKPEFQKALEAISKIQKPILDNISNRICETLKVFLPNVKNVKIEIPREARFRALRREYEIVVDDGTPTHLSRKGDGAQSLAALSLIRHSSESGAGGRHLILAVEEPESHLHPRAIHQLKHVIGEIAAKHQVIMTTHCPLFVDRANIKSNILVHHGKAIPAASVKEIRDILGVRAADNLQHAELVLIVEGEEDKKAVGPLLSQCSSKLRDALNQNTIAIETLHGGTNLRYKLEQIQEALCLTHVLLDHDACGIEAQKLAEAEGLMTMADVTFTTVLGAKESEIEDLYDESLYTSMLSAKWGVSTLSPKFKGNDKWSNRLRETFRNQGKTWSDAIEAKVKSDVAELVALNPAAALNAHKRAPFDALVTALEAKLLDVAKGRQ